MNVVKLLDSSLEVVREVSQSALVRELGDLICESAKMVSLLDQECCAANLSSCACSFHTGCTAADYYYVTWLVDFKLLIFFTLDNSRVYSTSDRSVVLNTVSCASDVAADALSDVTYITEFYLVYPVRVSDQASADADEVSVAPLEDVIEQQDYVVETNHLPHLITLIMNDEFFKGMPEENQRILKEAAATATEYARQASDDRIADRVKTIEDSGTQILKIDEETYKAIVDESAGVRDSIKEKVDSEVYNTFIECINKYQK